MGVTTEEVGEARCEGGWRCLLRVSNLSITVQPRSAQLRGDVCICVHLHFPPMVEELGEKLSISGADFVRGCWFAEGRRFGVG